METVVLLLREIQGPGELSEGQKKYKWISAHPDWIPALISRGLGTEYYRYSVSYAPAVISESLLRELLRHAGAKIETGRLLEFRAGLEFALYEYIIAVDLKPSHVTSRQLEHDLAEIQSAASKFQHLLSSKREAWDAMFRHRNPEWAGPRSKAPNAPPAGLLEVCEIRENARETATSDLARLPYVDAPHDRAELNSLITSLIGLWDACMLERATFTGKTAHTRPSSFMNFLEACLDRIDARWHSSEALAKTCLKLAHQVRAE